MNYEMKCYKGIHCYKYNNEFLLDKACISSKMINWKATNTIGNYCISKSHMCHIKSS